MHQLLAGGCGDAADSRVIGYVFDYHGTGTDDGVFSDLDAMSDHGADSDVGTFTDENRAAEDCAGRDVGEAGNMAIVFDDGTRVDDGAFADACTGIHNGTGHDAGAHADFSIEGNRGGKMDEDRQLETQVPKEGKDLAAGMRCTDGADADERGMYSMVKESGAEIVISENLYAADAFTLSGWIGIQQTRDFPSSCTPDDFNDDLAMAARADPEDGG
jgi:hypothetical protein